MKRSTAPEPPQSIHILRSEECPFRYTEVSEAYITPEIKWDDGIEAQLKSLLFRIEVRMEWLKNNFDTLGSAERRECLEIQRALDVVQEENNSADTRQKAAVLSERFRLTIMERILKPEATPAIVQEIDEDETDKVPVTEMGQHIRDELEDILKDAADLDLVQGAASYDQLVARDRIQSFIRRHGDEIPKELEEQLEDRVQSFGEIKRCAVVAIAKDTRKLVTPSEFFDLKKADENDRQERIRTAKANIGDALAKNEHMTASTFVLGLRNNILTHLEMDAEISPERYMDNAEATVNLITDRIAALILAAPHMINELIVRQHVIRNIAHQTNLDFDEYLAARTNDQIQLDWARSEGLSIVDVKALDRLRKRLKDIKSIIQENSFFTEHYLKRDKYQDYIKLDFKEFEALCLLLRKAVYSYDEGHIPSELLDQLDPAFARDYDAHYADEVPTLVTKAISQDAIDAEKARLAQAKKDPVLDGRMAKPLKKAEARKDAYEQARLEEEVRQAEAKRKSRQRVGRVATLIGLAAGFLGYLTGIDLQGQHAQDLMNETEVAAKIAQNSVAKAVPQFNVQYDGAGSHYTAKNTSQLAEELMAERTDLSPKEQARLAAASTNTAILALEDDLSPHVNPLIPAKRSIAYLEQWGGYSTPIDSFKDHLAESGRNIDQSTTGELLEYVETHPEIGGEGTTELMDRMLGTVPSLTLDQEKATEAMVASMDMILKGDVEDSSMKLVDSLEEGGHYNLTQSEPTDSFEDATDVTDLLEPLDQDDYNVNQFMDHATDLPPEPRFVKPVLEKETAKASSLPGLLNPIDQSKLNVKPVETVVAPDLSDDLEEVTDSLEDEWFQNEEPPVEPVQSGWRGMFAKAKKTVSRWFA